MSGAQKCIHGFNSCGALVLGYHDLFQNYVDGNLPGVLIVTANAGMGITSRMRLQVIFKSIREIVRVIVRVINSCVSKIIDIKNIENAFIVFQMMCQISISFNFQVASFIEMK